MNPTKTQRKNVENMFYDLLDLDLSKELDPVIEAFELNIAKQNIDHIKDLKENFGKGRLKNKQEKV